MTIPLPWSLSKDDPAGPDLENRLQEMFDTLAQQFPIGAANLANAVLLLNTAGTNRVVEMGSGTITWPGGNVSSNALTVTHGLVKAGVAVTPVFVAVTVNASAGLTLFPASSAQTYTTTTFKLFANTVDGQLPLNTATTAVNWLAVA